MNKSILDKEIQEYIRNNVRTDVAKISLSKSPFSQVSPKELAQQIEGLKRCENKLPLWYTTEGIYFPEKLALEQCSSQITAAYKARLILGKRVIDLTGGFGVDSAFFAQVADDVTHCELNEELSKIAEHNSAVLGLAVKHIHGDGMEYITAEGGLYDTIYIDPSRRAGSRKVFMLQDCEPDIISHKKLLSDKCKRLIVKTAPLLDLQSTIKELGSVSSIHIISVRNECKEVLYIRDGDVPHDTDPPITCAAFYQGQAEVFTFRASEESAYLPGQYAKPLSYLYEPDVSLLKAGCFKLICKEYSVQKLHQHTHLYTSDTLQTDFIGRKFNVLNSWDYGTFIKKQKFLKANIICRNFPQDPESVRKKLRINDGGADYLLFCTGPNNDLLVVHCERIF